MENGTPRILSDADRERAAARERAKNRELELLDDSTKRGMLASAYNIAKSIERRWASARRAVNVDNPANGDIGAHSFKLPLQHIDAGTQLDYRNVLYNIAANTLNTVVERGPQAHIPEETPLVTQDEFRDLFMYDITLEKDRKLRSMSSGMQTTERRQAIEEYGSRITGAIDAFSEKFDVYYTKFNNMIHGIYNNQNAPALQFLASKHTYRIDLAATVLFNLSRISTNVKTSTLVSHGSAITGRSGTHAFVVTDLLEDTIEKVKASNLMDISNERQIEHIAADILRYGMYSTIISEYYPGVKSGKKFDAVHTRGKLDGKQFTDVINGPSYIKYDENGRFAICPKKIISLFLNSIGIHDPENFPGLTLTDGRRYTMEVVNVSLNGRNGITLASLLDSAAHSGALTPILLTGGDSNTSLDDMAASTDGEGDSSGAANSTEDLINRGMEELANGGGGVSKRQQSYNNMINGIASAFVNNNAVPRWCSNTLNINLPTIDELREMNSEEVADMATEIISKSVNYINRNNAGGENSYVAKESMVDGHSAITVYANGRALTKAQLTKVFYATTYPNSTRTWASSRISSFLGALLGFVYHYPSNSSDRVLNGDNGSDVTGGAASTTINYAYYEPEFDMNTMVNDYIKNGSTNPAMWNVVSGYIRMKGAELLSKFTNRNTIAEIASNCFGNDEMVGDDFDDYVDNSSQLIQYVFNASPRSPSFINGMLNTLNRADDGQRLINDWVKLIDALSEAGSVTDLFGDTGDDDDTRQMTCSMIADSYMNENIDAVISAFDGDMREYLDIYYSNPAGCDKAKLGELARKIYNENSVPYVRFDNQVASEVVRDQNGNAIGTINNYSMPASLQKAAAVSPAPTQPKPKPASGAKRSRKFANNMSAAQQSVNDFLTSELGL